MVSASPEEYLSWLRYARGYGERTIEAYGRDIKDFLLYLKGEGLDYRRLKRDEMREYIASLLSRGLSHRSLSRHLSALRGLYSYLVREGAALTSPLAGIRAPKVRKTLPDVLSKGERDRLLSFRAEKDDPLSLRDEAIVLLLLSTGLRASELVSLDLSSLDFQRRLLRALGKGRKERIVPFSKDAASSLARYIGRGRPALAKEGGNALFLNARGTRLGVRGLEDILRRMGERLGLPPGLHPHEFRHTFATYLLEGGIDLRTVQELMGHRSLDSTEIYTHLSRKTLRSEHAKAFPGKKG